jgi:NAD(P) transhydrogenase
MTPRYDYDLLVIGSGPAGHRAAIQGAKLEKRGGTGAFPQSQEALFRVDHVISNEIDVARHQLIRNGVDILTAEATFVDSHRLRLETVPDGAHQEASAAHIVIAAGTTTVQDSFARCDGQHIFTCDDLLSVEDLPRSLAVVGAGVIGLEYACIFAALGVRVTLIDSRRQLLRSSTGDYGGSSAPAHESGDLHGETGRRSRIPRRSRRPRPLQLASGKAGRRHKVLYSVGRRGSTDRLPRDGRAARG